MFEAVKFKHRAIRQLTEREREARLTNEERTALRRGVDLLERARVLRVDLRQLYPEIPDTPADLEGNPDFEAYKRLCVEAGGPILTLDPMIVEIAEEDAPIFLCASVPTRESLRSYDPEKHFDHVLYVAAAVTDHTDQTMWKSGETMVVFYKDGGCRITVTHPRGPTGDMMRLTDASDDDLIMETVSLGVGVLCKLATMEFPRIAIAISNLRRRMLKMSGPRIGDEYSVVDWSKAVAKPLIRMDAIGHHASPRRHERRGHFRTYPSGKRVWVRTHMVGDAERGIISHDYKLEG